MGLTLVSAALGDAYSCSAPATYISFKHRAFAGWHNWGEILWPLFVLCLTFPRMQPRPRVYSLSAQQSMKPLLLGETFQRDCMIMLASVSLKMFSNQFGGTCPRHQFQLPSESLVT